MIDFRYHLVSLVSVFLALAVGIVLGAGPLKETIGDTLAQQVEGLRKDRATLKAEGDTLRSGIGHRDDFITALTPGTVGGRLTGRGILLVGLPGADDGTLDDLRDALGAAGASVTGRVLVTDAWTDPARATARDELAASLQPALRGTPAAAATGQTALAALLTRAVMTDAPATTATVRPGTAVLEALDKGEVITTEGDVTARASGVVLVAPPVATQTDAKASASPGATPQDVAAVYASLSAAFDAVAQGSVVVGPPSSAGSTGVVAAIRSTRAIARQVSTVDTGETSMGVLSGVLALDEQFEGAAGAYGFAQGASAPLPEVTAAAPAPAATP